MKPVFKYAQEGLKQLGLYAGKIDGIPGPQTERGLNRLQWLHNTGWR